MIFCAGKRRSCGLIAIAVLASSTANGGRLAADEEIIVFDDVTYATIGDTDIKLDLARPAGEGPFPAIVFIHGGGWYQGSRKSFRKQMIEGVRRGYVGVSINYRLLKFDEAKKETTTAWPIFPAQIHDCKAAIRWLRANAEKYRADSERIGVIGGSAGGHLSLLIGLSDDKDGLEGEVGHRNQSSRVQAVVNVFGITDMVRWYQQENSRWILRLLLGGTPKQSSEIYRVASPVSYISSDDPPILTLHGEKDTVVPLSQSLLLDRQLREAGISHSLKILKGHGHGPATMNLPETQTAIWRFFDEHLN